MKTFIHGWLFGAGFVIAWLSVQWWLAVLVYWMQDKAPAAQAAVGWLI